jgi:hypothetical protein
MWCWRRTEISCIDRVKNEDVLPRVNEKKNFQHTCIIKRRISHILRRNCLLKHVTEGKHRGKDRSEGKTRKRMQAVTGWP